MRRLTRVRLYTIVLLFILLAVERGASFFRMVDLSENIDAGVTSFWYDTLWLSVIAVVLAWGFAFIIVRSIDVELKKAEALLDQIARGDLSAPTDKFVSDELNGFVQSVDRVRLKFVEAMRHLDDSVRDMAGSAFQVAAISHEITNASKNEQARANDVSLSNRDLREITATVCRVADQASQHATVTDQHAKDSAQLIRQNIDAMVNASTQVDEASMKLNSLNESVEKINAIVSAIRSIAEQTNLLALNAAIEAARAGEQGRGFAVVADEVRNLAARTTTSTGEINAIINELNVRVKDVMNTMAQAVERVKSSQISANSSAAVISTIAEKISVMVESCKQISSVSSQQHEQLDTIQSQLTSLFGAFQETANKVENTATIGDDLYRVTEVLNQFVNNYSFSKEKSYIADEQEKRQSPRLMKGLRVKLKQGGRVFDAITRDLSLTGAQIRSMEPIASGESVGVAVYVPIEDRARYEAQTPIELTGKVRWARHVDEFYLVGVHFDPLTPKQESGLKECFDFYAKEPRYLVAGATMA